MNDKTSVVIVYLATIVKLVINMEINCVQVVIIVHLKQEPPMLTPALLGVTLKNKEHKASWTAKTVHQVITVKLELVNLSPVQRVHTTPYLVEDH